MNQPLQQSELLRIARNTLVGGGTTFQLIGGEAHDYGGNGWGVGGSGASESFYWDAASTPTLDQEAAIINLIAARVARYLAANPCIGALQWYGTWLDRDSGLVWLDVTTIFLQGYRDYAIQLAAVRGEIAIWDYSTSTELRLTDLTKD